MSVSTQEAARWFAPSYGDLRPSGSSHASSAYFPSQCKRSKALQVAAAMARGRVPGYAISQSIRKRIEESFGYIEGLLGPSR
jgi:hypothetical protein